MNISKLTAIGIVFLFSALQTGCERRDPEEGKITNSETTKESPPLETEEQWSALQIAQFIADFAALISGKIDTFQPVQFAQKEKLEGFSVFSFKLGDKTATAAMESGLWNQKTYSKWADLLIQKTDQVDDTSADATIQKTLLEPTVEVFLAENRRISDLLHVHPASAGAHVQAAVLLGTIGLNDYAGEFRDTRRALNRMTAHLAVAQALGVDDSKSTYRLAEALRLTLCGQQRDAVALLQAWRMEPNASPSEAEWMALLQMRNTLDWRGQEKTAKEGSLALKLEYFRTLAQAATVEKALDFLRTIPKQTHAGFFRIAGENRLSVSQAHIFSKPIFGINYDEIKKTARAFNLPVNEKDMQWLASYLDIPEGSPVNRREGTDDLSVEVAGPNFFAGMQQRQLMQGMERFYLFLNDKWGVAESASKLKIQIKNELPEMRYKPFLLRLISRTNEEYLETNAVCERVIERTPELVSPPLWVCLNQNFNRKNLTYPYPDWHNWYNPEVPTGTAYEHEERIHDIGVGDEVDLVWLKELSRRAPYSYAMGFQNAVVENNNSWENIDPEVITRCMGPLADYHYKAMAKIASTLKPWPDKYEIAMKKVIEINPDANLEIAEYFVQKELPEKAAVYYWDAFNTANDRVNMALESGWLIQYLFETGRKDKALQVAENAAATYSYQGLMNYMFLMESLKEWDKALETGKKIDERYNAGEQKEEISCFNRLQAINPRLAKAKGYGEIQNVLFPDGLKQVRIEDFSGLPPKGVTIKSSNSKLTEFGLRSDMIIVALNGYRTDNFAQYAYVRSLSTDPEMKFIVWDGRSYFVREGRLPGRLFGVDMGDYTP